MMIRNALVNCIPDPQTPADTESRPIVTTNVFPGIERKFGENV